ncbi:cytochrome P450 [Saccharopolyspora lacisalsi]|uniref:Cytochrome P450 n=1 Tax=Halosaccharopolyspora lacisalsi TaxID=1000566 RepID=A0A839DZF8_9PSEU|nr:cytochrome P450 [Halosaccharopolyspora lacisalsi]MBA8824601.1 cytochrome P450 [Halosaccharopolyspora lacisalsi]
MRTALADSRLSVSKENSYNGYRGFSLPPALDTNLLNTDPPEHTRLRSMVSKAFTSRRVEHLRDRVQSIADDLVGAMDSYERVDLMEHLAGPLPITVIRKLLGVPDRGRPNFRAWTDELLAPDPDRPEPRPRCPRLPAPLPRRARGRQADRTG